MALDTTAPKTRRAILAGACGGAAALAVSALVKPAAALANDGDNAILGQWNQQTTATGFETASPDDTGVWAQATATSGQGRGLCGESASPEGTGVWGSANATSGYATGVIGKTASPDGTGVSGSATAKSGGAIGVSGEAASPDGSGVWGTATATSGGAVGVNGSSESTEGTGVHGRADATSGQTYGVYGETFSPNGTGVYGYSQATTGGAGVIGWCDSTDGLGVWGFGGARGVWGNSEAGTGVFGHSGGMTGVLGFAGIIDMGVPGPSPASKTGVFGYSDLDATSVGVLGKSTTGTGVRAVATTGTAIYASTSNAKSGTALRTIGRVRFDNSVGIATIGSGKSGITVTPGIDLSTTSAVVATLQANPSGSITVQGVLVNATANTFTIYLTATASSAMKVAWHVFG